MKMISRLCALVLITALAACQSGFGEEATPSAPALTLQSVAERPATTAASQAAPAQAVHPALWKVADEDTTIYIFGTVHILPKGIDWFNGKIEQAFDASQLLVTEITGGDRLTMQALVMDKAMLTDGQTLRDLLSEEERTAYENALTTLGVRLSAFDAFEPWYASVELSTLPLMQEGFAGENGVEELLHARASENGVPQEGLETAEYQLSLFYTLPLHVQKNYLAEIISELPNIKTQLRAMIEAWKSGNADELARLINSSQSDPVLIDRLLTSRSKTWALWVAERLDEPGTVFLAVGAAHIVGEGSLQDQLAMAGIANERIQ
jgi:uncharacterized protein YbaP (TraB family)